MAHVDTSPPRLLIAVVGLGALSFLLYAYLLLFALEPAPNAGTYSLVAALSMIYSSIGYGLIKRSRLAHWTGLTLLGIGALFAVPNATSIPEFHWFYLLQGVIQLSAAICLVLSMARRRTF
jgi:hypothetical protein